MDYLFLILAIVFVIISCFAYAKYVEKVRKESVYLKELWRLNECYKQNFKIFNPNENYHKNCNSKQQYDKFNKENFIMALVDENLDRYLQIIENIKHNRAQYNSYEKQIKINLDNNETKKSYLFKKIEEIEFEKDKLKPPMELFVGLSISYRSPKGKNCYHKHCAFNSNNIQYYCQKCVQSREYKKSAKYQRSLMSDKLRYEVLKRDGFRCVCCGAVQSDGVKLHVDHIKPVSKGGLTEMSNLRTLCERCNLGKGASYNPNGYN